MIYVRIMVDEEGPTGSYQVAPNIRYVNQDGLEEAILTDAKTIYAPTQEAGRELREMVAAHPEMTELGHG